MNVGIEEEENDGKFKKSILIFSKICLYNFCSHVIIFIIIITVYYFNKYILLQIEYNISK